MTVLHGALAPVLAAGDATTSGDVGGRGVLLLLLLLLLLVAAVVLVRCAMSSLGAGGG
jgi:hypothetical protein